MVTIFNVGTGESVTIENVALRLAKVLGSSIEPEITGKYRVGDIRHCFPDLSRTASILGYRAKVTLEEGMRDLAAWLDLQTAHDNFHEMSHQLASRGLVG